VSVEIGAQIFEIRSPCQKKRRLAPKNTAQQLRAVRCWARTVHTLGDPTAEARARRGRKRRAGDGLIADRQFLRGPFGRKSSFFLT
jgi:hypothetical protein